MVVNGVNWGYNVGERIIDHPFGRGLYRLFMVMTGGLFIIYFTHITLFQTRPFQTCDTLLQGGAPEGS